MLDNFAVLVEGFLGFVSCLTFGKSAESGNRLLRRVGNGTMTLLTTKHMRKSRLPYSVKFIIC